jgi:hypothetical protein
MLTIAHQRRYRNQGFTMKLNRGLDTETYKGYVKLICDDEGNFKFIDDFEQLLQFLTRERFRNQFNWFFNIKYDFESIIKYLSRDELVDLYLNHELELYSKTISYIDRKFFSINDNKNSRFYYYDMFGFIETSLNEASKKYLGETKLSDVVDSSRLNTDIKYWNENESNIIKYCIKDANLTKRVADYFWNLVYKNMEYYPKRPFSKGKIAEEYFLSKCFIPTINDIPHRALELAYNSYLGGRFELIQKGYFEKCYTYDIKSAYPAIIANLIDYNKGIWKRCKNGKINKDAYSGYYECRIDCLELYVSPFTRKIPLSIYPNGNFKQTLTKNEIEFIRKNFNSADIKIIDGIEFFPDEILTPFSEEINKLYAWKEREKDEDVKYAVKIFMNAFYGKTIQKSGDLNLTGKVFNPIWASEITSQTRLKLLSLMLQDIESVIGCSTDSVHCTKPRTIPKAATLGDFSLDFTGQGVYIMSDVYYLWNDETKKEKNKLRGFSLAKTKDMSDESETADKKKHLNLKQILETMKNTEIYKYETLKPYHLGECLLHTKKRKISDLNIFAKETRSIKINGDKKRIWKSEFKNGKDCLKRNIQSMPIIVKGR